MLYTSIALSLLYPRHSILRVLPTFLRPSHGAAAQRGGRPFDTLQMVVSRPSGGERSGMKGGVSGSSLITRQGGRPRPQKAARSHTLRVTQLKLPEFLKLGNVYEV